MRDDAIACRFDRQFQHHVILCIAEDWAPEKVDPAVVPDRAEVINDVIDVAIAEAQRPIICDTTPAWQGPDRFCRPASTCGAKQSSKRLS